MRKFAIIALFGLLVPLVLSAAQLVLRDGTIMYGNFISGSPRSIIFEDSRGIRRTFNLSQVSEINFQPESTANRSYDNPEPYREQPYREQPYRETNTYRNDSYGAEWKVLPVGAELSVRTIESIDPRNAVDGRAFNATIAQDVTDGYGSLIIPRGSDATLVVRRVPDGGGLVLDLESVRVDGRRYLVDTSDIRVGNRSGIGANRRTAEMVGGGAALGTLLGALAGGGKGAAIGAIAGAVAGGGVQVLTRGNEIRVPAETVLNFRLDEPLRFREARY